MANEQNVNLIILDLIQALKEDNFVKTVELVNSLNANYNPVMNELYTDIIITLQASTDSWIYALKNLEFTKDKTVQIWRIEFFHRIDKEPLKARDIVSENLTDEIFDTLLDEQVASLIKVCVEHQLYDLLDNIRSRIV